MALSLKLRRMKNTPVLRTSGPTGKKFMLIPPAVWWGAVVLPERVLERQPVELRLVRREEHQRVLLAKPVELAELLAVVVDAPVALPVEPVDAVGDDVDQERAVACGDLLQVPRPATQGPLGGIPAPEQAGPTRRGTTRGW